jgi:hypothetical protein
MLKSSKLAILLRRNPFIYGTYLNLFRKLSGSNYSGLQSFVYFVGYPRSGSSTLGSLLDAHENMIISHEVNILDYLTRGFSRNHLLYLVERNSQLFNKSGRDSSGYKGIVEGQMNGRATTLKILGDKKAGKTSYLLENKPELLNLLQEKLKIPVKGIHIVRNPFDMITTQAYGGNEKQAAVTKARIDYAIDFCFLKLDTLNALIQSGKHEIYTLKHESLLQQPNEELLKLLDWLKMSASDEYLSACVKHLYKAPHKSRHKYNWSENEISRVNKKIEIIPFLNGYSFES